MRLRSLAIVSLLLATVLSGCTSPSGVTAKGELPVADAAAKEWAADARLVGVYAMEATNLTELRDQRLAKMDANETARFADDAAAMGANDSNPGDGRAPRWTYGYRSESKGGSLHVVVGGGAVVATQENNITEMNEPITMEDWVLDSDAAVAVAAAANATYASMQGRSDVVAYSGLVHLGELYPHPIWLLGFEPFGGGPEIAVFVDATNGTVLDIEKFGELLAAWLFRELGKVLPAEAGSDRGLLTVADPVAAGTFTLSRPHGQLALALTTRSGTVPLQDLQVRVTGPEGTAAWLNHTVDPGFDGATSVLWMRPDAGDYAFEVTLRDGTVPGTAASWDFSWCTEGLVAPMGPFGGGPVACEHRTASA